MSKAKEELISLLRERLGTCADPTDVVDQLFNTGAMDDSLARRSVMFMQFVRAYANSDKSAYMVKREIGEEYGISWQGLNHHLRK